MKKIVTVTEVEGEGLEAFLGLPILLMCENYNYAGTVEGVNETFVKLSSNDARIVYETGDWKDKHYKDEQRTGGAHYVRIDKVESFLAGKPAK